MCVLKTENTEEWVCREEHEKFYVYIQYESIILTLELDTS